MYLKSCSATEIFAACSSSSSANTFNEEIKHAPISQREGQQKRKMHSTYEHASNTLS
jgi:hypothetical protein